MKKILLVNFGKVIESAGGAERVLCFLANGLNARGYDVQIVCSEDKVGRPFFNLDQKVKFINLGLNLKISICNRVIRKICSLLHIDYKTFFNNKEINKQFEAVVKEFQPDLIINFFPEHLFYIFSFNHSIPVIEMLHSSSKWLINSVNNVARYNMLQKVSVMQVLLPKYADDLQDLFKGKIEVISNVVPHFDETTNYNKSIVYLSRYDRDKQIDHLVEAFSKIHTECPEWNVHIYGDEWSPGYKAEIVNMICEKNLEKKIFAHGKIDDIKNVLLNASICAFPSKYEGFPMALTEAMSAGLPCVGYVSCSGVNQLIIDGENGFLAEDSISDFSSKLNLLMQDDVLCKIMGANARFSMEKYSEEIVLDCWVSLIESF